MATASAFAHHVSGDIGSAAARREASSERASLAPCLGLALLAACGLWAGLGSAVALVLA